MATRSKVPSGIAPDMAAFLDDEAKKASGLRTDVDSALTKIAAVNDLATTPTETEIAAAFNSLLAAMRAAGKMETN